MDSSSNGSIQNKSIQEAYDLCEIMSKQSAMWPNTQLQMGASGARENEAYSLVLAKIDSLARKVEVLSTFISTSHSTHMVQSSQICDTCGAYYPSSSCPLMGGSFVSTVQVTYAQNFQRQRYNPMAILSNYSCCLLGQCWLKCLATSCSCTMPLDKTLKIKYM